MPKMMHTLLGCAAMILGVSSASAQAPQAHVEVVAAAVNYIRSDMAGRGEIGQAAAVGLDPRVIQGGYPADEVRDDIERANRVARLTNVSVSRHSEAIQCPQGPRSCRMNVALFLSFSEPVISGNKATLRAASTTFDPDHARQPLSLEVVDLTFERSGNSWVVVDVKGVGVS